MLKLESIWRSFLHSANALTTLPIPVPQSITDDEVDQSLLLHPLVGFTIGIVLTIVLVIVSRLNTTLAAVIVLITWIGVTGLVHLSGFIATVRTLFENKNISLGSIVKAPEEDPNAILSSIAIAILLLLKFAAITAAVDGSKFSVLILACIIARSVVIALIAFSENLVSSSYAGVESENANRTYIYGSATLAGIVAILIGGIWTILVITLCAVLAFVALVLIEKQNEATDGNLCHALVEIFEVVTLWITVFVTLS